MKENERERVAAFVQVAMRERYGSEAYALPEVVLTAWRGDEGDEGDELLGVMAPSFSHGAPFHLEETYAIQYRTFPAPFDRSTIVELGRFVAKVPSLAEALLYATIQYALRQGCVWGIGEVKPPMARRYTRMGIAVIPFAGESILANIPAGALPYYCSPPPRLAAIVLRDAAAALEEKVASLVAAGEIVFQ